MKNFVCKLLSLSMIVSLLSVSTAFAVNPEDVNPDREATLTISPEVVFSNYDITLDVAVDGGVDLPDVEWPDVGDQTVQEWATDNPDEYNVFALALEAEFDAGKDYIRVGIVKDFDTDDEAIVFDLLVLVTDHPYVTVTDDGFRMFLPGGVDELDFSAGDYRFQVIGSNMSTGDLTYGYTDLVVTDFPLWILDLDIFDGFMLPDGEEEDEGHELPASIQINPAFADPGQEVTVNVFAEDGETLTFLEPDWEIEVWPMIALIDSDPILTTENDSILADDDGLTFYFDAPDDEDAFKYFVDLVDAEGDIVWTEDLMMNEVDEDDNVFDGADLADILDIDDLLGDLVIPDGLLDADDDEEEEDEDEDVAEEAEVENVVDSTSCSDVELDYWGLEFMNPLIEDGLYPVLVDGPVITCRPQDSVLRKEFTAWLLAAYEPEIVAAIGDVDTSETGFTDVASDDIYAPYIVAAAELEIINGNPDGTFGPDNVINRAEVLKILLRSSGLFNETDEEMDALVDEHGMDLVNPDPASRFSDITEEDWYYKYTYYGVAKTIIQGYSDNTAKMGQGVLYSEAAKILYLARELEV
jgi:hypothetical protein